MSNLAKQHSKGIIRTEALLVLGILYLVLVASTFIFAIDLANDKTMQYVLHIAVILSALAYLMFVDTIYSAEGDRENGRPALIFAALYTVPVLIGRGIGLAVISFDELFAGNSIFNFYAAISLSRTVELAAWTTFFPLSMVFLAKLFFQAREWLARFGLVMPAVSHLLLYRLYVDSFVKSRLSVYWRGGVGLFVRGGDYWVSEVAA